MAASVGQIGNSNRSAGRQDQTYRAVLASSCVRISVLGNSDTTGMMLDSAEASWPNLIVPRLEQELGEDVQVDSWRFAPYRENAAAYALKLVDEAQPDFVVLTLSSFWCAFRSVRGRLEGRFGGRVGHAYNRLERAFSETFERSGPLLERRRRLSRRVARHSYGHAPDAHHR